MTRRETVIVESFGQLWRMSRPAYLKWLRARATGEDVEIPGRTIGYVSCNATDMNGEAAQMHLDSEELK